MTAGEFNAMAAQFPGDGTANLGTKYLQRRAVPHIIRLGIYPDPEQFSTHGWRNIYPGPNIEER